MPIASDSTSMPEVDVEVDCEEEQGRRGWERWASVAAKVALAPYLDVLSCLWVVVVVEGHREGLCTDWTGAFT